MSATNTSIQDTMSAPVDHNNTSNAPDQTQQEPPSSATQPANNSATPTQPKPHRRKKKSMWKKDKMDRGPYWSSER